MIRNYLLIALRQMRRQFSYTFINITGLAIGMACTLVILLYVYGEWSYDRHFKQADRIYRIGVSFYNLGPFAAGPEALFEYLPKEFDGIEAATRISRERDIAVYVKGEPEPLKESALYYTDSSFFHVFSYTFVEGNARQALANNKSVVITRSIARKYFNKEDAIGKTLELGKERIPFTVTGIVEDEYHNSHLKASIWASNETKLDHSPIWTSSACYNYVLLKDNATEENLTAGLDNIIAKKVYPASGSPEAKISLEEFKKNASAAKFYIQPLKDIHLTSTFKSDLSPSGNEANLYIFGAISIFILVLAGVNFINLSTARASRRAKEVGIRKALGTTRKALIGQFLSESVIVSIVAMFISLVFAEIFLRSFKLVTGTELLTNLRGSVPGIILVFAFTLSVGIISGLYPAFYLTSFRPVKVLKGDLSASGGGVFRNALVVFQFTISIALIICTGVVVQQLTFMQAKDLGFNQQNVLVIDQTQALKTSAEAFRQGLMKETGVVQSSFHTGEPASRVVMSTNSFKTAQMESFININSYFGDDEFLSTMGFRLIKGRAFDKRIASDSLGVILNEAAVKELGLGDNPIGAKLNEGQYVIGVVSDFHWESLRSTIAPAAILLGKEYFQLGFRLEGNNNASAFIKAMEAKWKQFVPDEPLRYHFLDENFGELLKQERTLGQAIGFFTALAIFISCLGLYGLAAFTAEQRTKEIGIRKVLGASVSNIVLMLNKKFTVLVIISIMLAVPLSTNVMLNWLEGFAYRTALGWWIFAGSVMLALVMAWATVSYHSLKAAFINPADTLKYE